MSKNRQYRTEETSVPEVVSRLGVQFFYSHLTTLLSQTENEGGRAKRRSSLCVSHRMSIPNQSASYNSSHFLHLCFMFFPHLPRVLSSSPALSTLMCFRGSSRIVHLGFSLDSPGPRPTAWHTYFFARTLHSSLCSHKFLPATLMHARLIFPVAFNVY